MGQYYYIVNPVKKQYLHPHKFGCGLKLMEFTNSQFGPQQALCILTSNGNGQGGGDLGTDGLSEEEKALIGSWAGDPIIVAGDYGEPWKFFDRAEYDGKTYETKEPLYRQSNGRVGTMDELSGSMTPTGKTRIVFHTFGQRKNRETGENEPHDENLHSLADCFFEDISDKMITLIAKGEEGNHPYAAVDLKSERGWRDVPEWGTLPEVEPKKPAGGKKLYNAYAKHAKPAMLRMVDEVEYYVLRHPDAADAMLALLQEKVKAAKAEAIKAAKERGERGY